VVTEVQNVLASFVICSNSNHSLIAENSTSSKNLSKMMKAKKKSLVIAP